jgi:hypothetical protein
MPSGQEQSILTQVLASQQNTLVAAIMPVFDSLGAFIKEQDKYISSVVKTITNQAQQGIDSQKALLDAVTSDLSTIVNQQISEQNVQLNLLKEMMNVQEDIYDTVIGSSQGPTLPIPSGPPVGPIGQPPITSGPPPKSGPFPPVTEPPKVPPPIVEKPILPPPPVIVVPPGDVSSTTNVTNNTWITDITSPSAPQPPSYGGYAPVAPSPPPPPPPPSSGSGGGTTGGLLEPKSSQDIPVDLDQPLAWKYARDDNYWKSQATYFYGSALNMYNTVETLPELISIREDAEKQAWPNTFTDGLIQLT